MPEPPPLAVAALLAASVGGAAGFLVAVERLSRRRRETGRYRKPGGLPALGVALLWTLAGAAFGAAFGALAPASVLAAAVFPRADRAFERLLDRWIGGPDPGLGGHDPGLGGHDPGLGGEALGAPVARRKHGPHAAALVQEAL